jgi:TolA-binding protein
VRCVPWNTRTEVVIATGPRLRLCSGLRFVLCAIAILAFPPGLARGQNQRSASPAPRASVRPQSDDLNFAHGLFRQRKFDLAAEEYQRSLDKNASGADADSARFGLAAARLYQGRYKESRQVFEEFLARAPGHPRAPAAWYRVGELSYMLGDLPAARKALETFVRTSSNHPNLETAWTYLGDVCLGLDDLAAARTAYQEAIHDFPKGQLVDRARYGLGRTLAGLGETNKAVAILTELAGGGGSDWIDRAWFQISKIQSGAGRHAEAVRSLETMERAVPRSPMRDEARMARAESLACIDRAAEAVTLLEPLAAQAAQPIAQQSVLALATIQLERARPDAALATLDRALERFPRSALAPALLFRSAEALQKLNRPREARERFLEVAKANPPDPAADQAVMRAAQLALEAGDHAAARTLAQSFARRFPDSPLQADIRLIEARSLLTGGQPRDAIAILESVLGLAGAGRPQPRPGANALSEAARAAASYDLALAYRSAGQADRADAMLASLAKSTTSPAGSEAQFLIGQEHVEKGRFAQAIAPLNQYLSKNATGSVADYALAHRATAELGLGQTEDAWKTLAQLAERFPRSKALPSARLRLGEAALNAGQADRAADQFRILLDRQTGGRATSGGAPRLPEATTDPPIRLRAGAGLARALWKLGKPGEAAELYGQIVDAFPDDPGAPRAALDQAGALEAAGQTDLALTAYLSVAARFPRTNQSLQAELGRARLLARTGHSSDAASAYMRVLFDRGRRTRLASLGETPSDLFAELGWALVDSQETEEADRVFTALLEDDPQSPRAIDARFNLAESANQARDFAAVIRLLSPLVSVPTERGRVKQGSDPAKAGAGPAAKATLANPRPLMPLILYRLGRTQIELGDWSAGSATLDRLLAEYPRSARDREARFLRAEAALFQNDPATAETMFKALLSEPPGVADPEGFRVLVGSKHVQSLLALKRWAEALSKAEALKLAVPGDNPVATELEFARGRALLGLARPEEARTAFQAVIDARKGGDLAAQAQLMRGETFFHQDRFHEALREFLRVDVEYDAPHWQAAALLEAGKVQERLLQWNDAVEIYESLCSRFRQDSHFAEANARLAAARKRISARG